MKQTLAFLFLIMLAGQLAGKNVQVNSAFNPSQILVGETGTLSVSIQIEYGNDPSSQSANDSVDMNSFPGVPGLEVAYQGPIQRTGIVNGYRTASLSLQFAVRAQQPGTYTLPAFPIEVGGVSYTVPEAQLTVTQQADREDSADSNASAWMDLLLPREHIYAYETIPFQVRLYIRDDMKIRRSQDFPIKEGDSFAVSAFSPPQVNMTRIDGVNYYVMMWQGVMTPLKAGDNDLKFKYNLYVNDPSNSRSSNISDPFFNGFFGSNIIMTTGNTRELELSSGDEALHIEELPTEGKPAHFSGAIGKFNFSNIEVEPDSAQVGEPVELQFTFEGAGNFQYMDAPTLIATDGWRLRGTEKDFNSRDRYDYNGSVTYRYILSAESTDVAATPGVAFSYFDPETEEYITTSIESLPITIKPAPQGSQGFTRKSASAPETEAAKRGLIGLRNSPGRWVSSMQPVFTSPLFLAVQVIPLAALLGLFFTRRHHNRLMTDKRYARERASRRAMKGWLDKAKAAASQNDPVAFYAAAQRALQESLGHLVEQEPSSLSADEIHHLLATRNVRSGALSKIHDFLNAGDALKFGGLAQSSPDLKREFQELEPLCQANLKLS